jgi:hypothetical protein
MSGAMQPVITHPDLIRANIFLARGDKAEARRMLGNYLKQRKLANMHDDPFILWLDAQTRADATERLQQLRLLVATTPPDNPYHRLAQHTLDIAHEEHPAKNNRLTARIIAIVLAIGALLGAGWLLTNLFAPTIPSVALITAEPTAEITETFLPTEVPVRLTALATETSVLSYDEGILTFTAIEDNAVRVVNRFSGERVQPIEGARFFVVFFTFECRIGICEQPPEATLTLVQSDDFTFVVRDDLSIGGLAPLAPIAFGIQTSGAFVFEIPFIGLPVRLEVAPKSRKNLPLEINLPVQ